MTPDQFGLDGFEKRLDSGVAIAIAFATHRHFEVTLAQDLLVIGRTVWAATTGVMDAAFVWCPKGYGHLQRTDRKITFHPIADHYPAGHCTAMSREGGCDGLHIQGLVGGTCKFRPHYRAVHGQ